jgi:serine/threonine-protein kinase
MANGKIVVESKIMNAEKYQKAKKIFNEAAEMSVLDRQNFVAKSCEDDSTLRREIEKMLIFADKESTTDTLEKNAFEIFSGKIQTKTPEQIGNYKIVREVGRGGMGAVYEAIRETEHFTHRRNGY